MQGREHLSHLHPPLFKEQNHLLDATGKPRAGREQAPDFKDYRRSCRNLPVHRVQLQGGGGCSEALV